MKQASYYPLAFENKWDMTLFMVRKAWYKNICCEVKKALLVNLKKFLHNYRVCKRPIPKNWSEKSILSWFKAEALDHLLKKWVSHIKNWICCKNKKIMTQSTYLWLMFRACLDLYHIVAFLVITIWNKCHFEKCKKEV